jgi:hypothetical protein
LNFELLNGMVGRELESANLKSGSWWWCLTLFAVFVGASDLQRGNTVKLSHHLVVKWLSCYPASTIAIRKCIRCPVVTSTQ